MSMIQSIDSSIRRFGNKIIIHSGEDCVDGRAFVEPLRYRNKIYVGGEYHSLGSMRREKYLYIGTAENPLTENATVIESNNCKYIVKRCETYYVNDLPVYVWAILVLYGDELEDEYDADKNAD